MEDHLELKEEKPNRLIGIGNIEDANIKKRLDNVTLLCQDGTIIQANRNTLASFSEFFRALLFGHFRETSQTFVKLENVDGNLMKLLIQFYEKYHCWKAMVSDDRFCRIHITDYEMSWRLIEIADMMGMEEAAKECDKYVIQTMTSENVNRICGLAEKFSRFAIQREAIRKWSIENFSLFSRKSYKSNYHDGCTNDCICYFSNHYDETEHLYLIGGYYWGQFRDCLRVTADKLLDKDKKDGKNNTDKNNVDQSLTNSREHGSNTKAGITQLPYSKCNVDTLSSYPGPSNEESVAVAFGTDIFVTGGFNENAEALSQVWKYDTRENKWERVSDMRHPRFYHCTFSVGDHVYVCGGFDDNFVLNTLERYHPIYNEWVDMAAMHTGVGNAAFASDDDGLYVICGQYGYKDIHTTNHVQHYVIQTDQWEIITDYESPVFYPHSEYGLSGAVLDGQLIIVGGQTERCDAYDIKNDTWKRIADSKGCRMEAAVSCVREKLLLIGGYDNRSGVHHDTIEEYNPDSNTWRILNTRLVRPCRSLAACFVFDVERKK